MLRIGLRADIEGKIKELEQATSVLPSEEKARGGLRPEAEPILPHEIKKRWKPS